MSRIRGLGTKGGRNGCSPISFETITHSNLDVAFWIFIPETLGWCICRFWFPLRNTDMFLLNLKLKLFPRHFKILMLLNQQTDKKVTVVTGVIDLNRGKLGHCYLMMARKTMSRSLKDSVGHFLALLCAIIMVDGKLWQLSNTGSLGLGSWEIKGWVILSGKNSTHLRCWG